VKLGSYSKDGSKTIRFLMADAFRMILTTLVLLQANVFFLKMSFRPLSSRVMEPATTAMAQIIRATGRTMRNRRQASTPMQTK